MFHVCVYIGIGINITKHHMRKEWRIVKEIFRRVLQKIKSVMTPTDPNNTNKCYKAISIYSFQYL